VIIGLLAYNLSKEPEKQSVSGENEFITVSSYVEPPPGRDPPPFDVSETGFTTSDPNIKMIEVNQGLSYGFDTDSGEFYLFESFVAGKETGLFVVLENPVDKSSKMTLTVVKNDEVVGVLTPDEMIDDRTILFQPKDMAEMNYWEQGAYAFVFEMDGSQAVRVVNFFRSMPVTVLIMPMISNYSGEVMACKGAWKNSSQMFLETYPVAEGDVEFVIGPEIDLSADRYDLNTEAGRYNVWKALRARQTPDGDYTLIVGFMPQKLQNYQKGAVWMGYTYGMPGNIICESEQDMMATVIHEIAHCYYIGDEYPNGHLNNSLNPPPYGMEGFDIVSMVPVVGEKQNNKSGYDYGLNGSGSVIYPEQRAYRVQDKVLLGTVSSFMGYATGDDSYTRWISSDIYEHLFDTFTGKSAWGTKGGDGEELFGQCPNCLMNMYDVKMLVPCHNCFYYTSCNEQIICERCGTRAPNSDYTWDEVYIDCENCWTLVHYNSVMEFNGGSSGAEEGSGKPVADPGMPELIMITEVTGYFDTDGTIVMDPWYSYPAPRGFLTANKDGEYAVCTYDAKGKLIGATYFDVKMTPEVTTAEGQFSMDEAWIPINIVIKHLDDAAKIVIQKGDEELYTRVVSANAPTVSFTGVSVDKQNKDLVTVTWDAGDADGEELFFQLYYQVSREEYYPLDTDITGNSYTIDLSGYPGSDQGYFYIYATDGVNTAETHSDYFNVSYTAPFFIDDTTEKLSCKITEELVFDPQAYDNQDGRLDWSSVTWYEDGDYYMEAEQLWILPYQVSPGVHTFTCVATNSAGESTSRDFTVEIVDDESDLPDDWSQGDIRYAMQQGLYLPLEWIDAPITRSQFARQMAFVYGQYSSLPGIYPHFDREGLVTDCGSNDLLEAMMVYLGVMEAPDGLFEPAGSMTEHEGAIIMYKVAIMADHQNIAADEFDEEEIIAFLFEIGVLDEDGPNVFEPDSELTGKQALARAGKMLWYSFGEDEE